MCFVQCASRLTIEFRHAQEHNMLCAVTAPDRVSNAVTYLHPCRIDEIHTLVGAGAVGRGGGGGGGLDISNLMKPALARGELQCIGATTLDEHRKHIEKDQALER